MRLYFAKETTIGSNGSPALALAEFRDNYRSLLQKWLIKKTLFCKKDYHWQQWLSRIFDMYVRIWICTTRYYWGIWVYRFGGFRGCGIFSGNCHVYDNFSIHIQIKLKSQFEFVLRDTEESEFMDLVDFGDVAFSVEIVIYSVIYMTLSTVGWLRVVGSFKS